jgi:protein SCO1
MATQCRKDMVQLLVLLAAFAAGPLQAHPDGHETPKSEHTSKAEPATVSTNVTRDARSYFTDTLLVNQDSHSMRFYSDVLQDRVVLINVIYTSCEDACPLITRKLVEVRTKLGDRFGKEVQFVSISIDPERDSPQALKKFAHSQGADEAGWVFLTGAKVDVDRVLSRLGQLSPAAEDHSTLLIAGNVGAKRWSKIRPDAPVTAIAERLQVLAGKR